MNTWLKLGEHYLFELSDCDQTRLYDADASIARFFQAIRDSGLTVMAESSYKFAPHGFSAYTLLAESHASVHAWPEHGYCAIDVFTCNLHLDLNPLFERLQQDFGAQAATLTRFSRAARPQPKRPTALERLGRAGLCPRPGGPAPEAYHG